ncbi:ParB N-terminal domain-containing protein [Alphaproteobacteria bacterium]|nr:ParB N-terminal domain-containing protein [Alphaproteobacteria bacterium]
MENLVDQTIIEKRKSDKYEVLGDVDPDSIFNSNRFDIGFKLIALKSIENEETSGIGLYLKHINCFSKGSYIEHNSEKKIGKRKFIHDLREINNSIRSKGFNPNVSLIPISQNEFSLLNGSHRLACSIYHKKKVSICKLDVDCRKYDYQFFLQRGMSINEIDWAAQAIVKHIQNIHVAIIWPVAQGKREKITEFFDDIVYSKEIELNQNGIFLLTYLCYRHSHWVGNVENGFSGVYNKVKYTSSNTNKVTVLIINNNNMKDLTKIKHAIREFCGIGNHSIHITDTKNQAIELTTILNDNSIHFFNNAKPFSYILNFKMFQDFYSKIPEYRCDDVAIDSSMVMSIYGIREAADLDYISLADFSIKDHDSHNKLYEKFPKAINELILNPNFHFSFMGIKFISLKSIVEFKKIRAEPKDLVDVKMISNFVTVEKLRIGFYMAKLRWSLLIIYWKLRSIVKMVLKWLRLL